MIETFDVQAWLDDVGIGYEDEGRDVSTGWIGISCLFCSDHLFHLGINLSSKRYSCWRCGAKGSVAKLIMHHNQITWGQAQAVLQRYQDPTAVPSTKPIREYASKIRIPNGSHLHLPPLHEKWLESRGFDANYIHRRYSLRCTTLHDRWPFSLIVPVYLHHQLVTFIFRDVGEGKADYKNFPIEESLIDAKHTLYNLDRVGHTALVVEGITDVWRIGDGAVATMGTKWTKAQVKQLMGLKRVFVMYDSEEAAQQQAERLACALTSGVKNVVRLELPKGDPADLDTATVNSLRREIFGR